MDETLQQLLDTLPKGEELIDPRVGDYDEAEVSEVELVENGPDAKNRYAVAVTFKGLTDSEGRDFELTNRLNIPTSSAEPQIKRMFLADLHSLEVVPREYQNAITADTDEHREQLVSLVSGVIGVKYPIAVKQNGAFVNVRIKRRR